MSNGIWDIIIRIVYCVIGYFLGKKATEKEQWENFQYSLRQICKRNGLDYDEEILKDYGEIVRKQLQEEFRYEQATDKTEETKTP